MAQYKHLRQILNEKKISDMSDAEHKNLRYNEAEGHQWHATHPVHHMNIVNHFNQATEGEKHHGMNWYADAHKTMKAVANDTGVPHHTMAGLVSNYSPQTPWHANILTAARVARHKQALGGPGSGVMASGHQKQAAHRMLQGEHYNNVLVGHKVRHFAHLIEHGGNEHHDKPHVVIDRHAYSVAAGARMTDAAFGLAGLKNKKKYMQVHKAYVDAAHHLSKQHGYDIHPHQVQAVTWLARQRMNAAEEKAGVKKRNTAGVAAKAKSAWDKYAGEHHPRIVGKEPGTGWN